MIVKQRPTESIQPDNNNLLIRRAAVEEVAASSNEFGLCQPIVVDDNGVVVVGHTRYEAAAIL
jgi:ParB-like chromosome segregation protein Spo0J